MVSSPLADICAAPERAEALQPTEWQIDRPACNTLTKSVQSWALHLREQIKAAAEGE